MRILAAPLAVALVSVPAALALAQSADTAATSPSATVTGAAAAPKTLQVPTGAFFGTISGTVEWPPQKTALGKPKDKKTACSKITVRALKRDPSAEGGFVELRKVQASGGSYPTRCTFKMPGVRIRQDVVLEASFPSDAWVGCSSSTFASAPAKGAKWTNPVQLEKSSEVKRPLALSVTCTP